MLKFPGFLHFGYKKLPLGCFSVRRLCEGATKEARMLNLALMMRYCLTLKSPATFFVPLKSGKTDKISHFN